MATCRSVNKIHLSSSSCRGLKLPNPPPGPSLTVHRDVSQRGQGCDVTGSVTLSDRDRGVTVPDRRGFSPEITLVCFRFMSSMRVLAHVFTLSLNTSTLIARICTHLACTRLHLELAHVYLDRPQSSHLDCPRLLTLLARVFTP